MKVTRSLLPFLIIVLAGIVAWSLSLYQKEPENKNVADKKKTVRVKSIELEDTTLVVESQGTIAPVTETTLVAEISGTILSVSPAYVAGGIFKKGDVLIQIDPVDYDADVQKKEAELAAKKAQLSEELARSDAEKATWLSSGRQLEDAPPLLIRIPYVDEARAGVKSAEAELKKAKIYLNKTTIRAPYDGMVKTKSVDLGQYIRLGDSLGTVFSTDAVEVRLPISNSMIEHLNLQMYGMTEELQRVMLSSNVGQSTFSWQGYIVRSEGVVDEKNRMHFIVVRVDDPYLLTNTPDVASSKEATSPPNQKKHNEKDVSHLQETVADAKGKTSMPKKVPNHGERPLKVGTFVYALISGDILDDVIIIPRNLLRRNNEVLVAKDSVMHLKPVNVLYSSDDKVYIRDGLAEGDQLIITPVTEPIEGTPVRVVP